METKLRVLIVEDLPSDAELTKRELKKILKDPTVKIVESEDGFAKALEEFKPDLIISDYMLPTFDGLAALKLRQQKSPHIPFIMLTSSVNEETAVECMKTGADDYVLKKHIKRLGSAVKKALNNRNIELEHLQVKEDLIEANKNLEMFGQTVHSINECVSITDKNHNIIFVNSAFLKTYGYSKEEVLSKSVEILHSKKILN